MAEGKIDELFDLIALNAQADKVLSKLTEVAATIKTFPKAQIFADVSNQKELYTAQTQMSTVLDQLKVKNAELTVAIKEQNLAAKQAVAQKKLEAQAAKDAANAAKEEVAARKAASRQAQIDGQERIKQLRLQAEEEQKLADAEKGREESQKVYTGTYNPGGNRTTAPSERVQYNPTSTSDALAFSLVQDQRQLASTKADLKLLTAEYKLGKVSQAEYDEQVVKSIQLQNDLKVSIANTSKELSLQAKSNASIPGTIEALQTRNAVLSQQASQVNVVNATPEDVAQLKVLNDEIDKNNELIRVNKDLLAQQKINIGNYPTALGQTFKTLNTELEQVQGKLVQGNFAGKEFDQLTAKQTVLQNALSLTGKTFSSSAAEASAYKEAALQIGQVYGKDSNIFKQFAEGVKTGAANTAALAGELSGVVTKGKGFTNFLSTAWNGIRKLAYAIPGLGIGGVVLLLLGPLQAAGEALIKYGNTATKAGRDFEDFQAHQKNTQDVLEKSADAYGKATSEVSKLTEDVRLAKEGIMSKDEVLKEYNETMGKTTGQLKNFDELEAKMVADGPDYIKLLFLKAEATAAYALAGEAARKALTAQSDAEKNFGITDFLSTNKLNLIKQAFGFGNVGEAGKNAADQVKKNADEIKTAQEKAFNDLNKQGDDFEKKAAELAKKHNWHLIPDPNDVKKTHEDSQRLLDEYRKKDLEALSTFSNDQLKVIQEQNKKMASDDQLSLQERLDYEQKYYAASLALLQNQKQAQIDALNLEANTALKNAKRINDPKLRAETDIAIEKYRTDQLKVIDQTFADSTLKLNESLYSDNVEIANQAYEKINKIAEESAKFRQGQEKIAFQNKKDTVDIDRDNQLLQLEKDYQSGSIKSLEEYNQRKEDINTAADIKQKQLDLKRIQDAEKFIEAMWGVKNLSFIKQAKDLEVEIETEGDKKILEAKKALVEASKELRDQLEQSFTSIVDSSFDAKNAKDDAQLKAIQDRSQKEIDAINASGLAQAEKEKRIQAIQKQTDFQSEQISKRQQQRDIAKAKFDRAMSIVSIVQNTAQAITKAVAEFPLTGGMPFVAIDAAIGAAQIAAVLARPLPHYKKGTENAKRGPALVSEEGSELVVDRTGKMFLTPKQPTLIELAGGEKIFRHDETEKILSHYNLLNIIQKANTVKRPVIDKEIERKMLRVMQNIERKSGITIINNVPVESTAYYQRNIKN